MRKILIIEDDLVLCRVLRNWLERKRIQVDCVSTLAAARKALADTDADVILSDMRLPDGDGIELLEWMNKNRCRIPFIVITQHAEVASAVRAMKLGAEDYLPKPFQPETLYTMLEGVLRHRHTEQERGQKIFRRESREIRELIRRAELVAATDLSVLVRGENGTGKEHIARLIHTASPRADKPFVAVDCGAISKELAASEFFGHVKGAFTGATGNKTGVFHEAEGGTLFLDEIGNLPYEVQVLLLRASQERCYRPVGGKREMPCDVRIIAATNENIEKAIGEGRFREDLFHRLNEFSVEVPPLRECREDILPLAEFFLQRFAEELNRNITGFSVEAQKKLQSYGWPGNVRELKNTVRKAILLAAGNIIGLEELDLNKAAAAKGFALREESEERERIIKALEAAKYNKALAAGLLQISRPTLYEKMKKYGIDMEK
ncbi:sigma-54-dependent transcriptional regulator [Bacteroides fragilis]